MRPEWVLLGGATVFFVVFAVGFLTSPPDPIAVLRRDYLQLIHLGAESEEHLSQRLEALRAKNPGKTERWYLQWLVDDLRRAKR